MALRDCLKAARNRPAQPAGEPVGAAAVNVTRRRSAPCARWSCRDDRGLAREWHPPEQVTLTGGGRQQGLARAPAARQRDQRPPEVYLDRKLGVAAERLERLLADHHLEPAL